MRGEGEVEWDPKKRSCTRRREDCGRNAYISRERGLSKSFL